MPWADQFDWTDGDMVGAFAKNVYVRDDELHLYHESFPRRVTLWHEASLVTAGNALAAVTGTSYHNNYYIHQNAAANADTFTQSASLAEGEYIMRFTGQTHANGGYLVVRMDGVFITSFNFYTAGSTIQPFAGGQAFVVPASKRVTLEFKVEGQDAASGGYDVRISSISILPVDGDA